MNEFVVYAFGHPNIRANHATTWQVTTEANITVKGDCIIGVKATASTKALPLELKKHLQYGGRLEYFLILDGEILHGISHGHPDLTLDDHIDIVMRKSEYISPRTIAIRSSLTARQIPREWVTKLQDPQTRLEIHFQISK